MATRSTAHTNPHLHKPKPDHRTVTVSLLKLCNSVAEVHQIHARIIKTGLAHDLFAVNSIIEFAAVSDSGRNLVYAQSVFERVRNPPTFAKNLMIRGHSQSQNPSSAIKIYGEMLTQGFEINCFAFTFLLQALTRSVSAFEGKQVHGQILKSGETIDAHLASSIIRFYSEVNDLDSASRTFDSSRGFVGSWNSMINAYSKAGEIEKARTLFDEMPKKTLISWTALITGYTHSGRYRETLDAFQTMQRAGIRPDERTIVTVLPSISRLGSLSLGKWVHSYIENSGMEINPFLGSALVDMYSKCGCIETAQEVFHKIGPTKRNVVMWNAMIGGLAMHGRAKEALHLFDEMLHSGVRPSDVTFVGILRACSHAGMVDEGLNYFKTMSEVFLIESTVEHYGCMVDLLSRAGRLEEAEKLVMRKRKPPDLVGLKTLLGACRIHGNIEIGERVGKELIDLASDDSSCYVLLSNLYASAGRWNDVTKTRDLMREKGVKKIAGCSSIELENSVHEFHAGDLSHPRIKEIYTKLEEIGLRLKSEGYKPDTTQVLAEIGDEEKETALYRHSEKLAIAFGLINSEPGSRIRVVKNLRVCPDCHTVTKLISRIYDREIIVRDHNRFHHFKNGSCSCNGYW